jgi:hypothetical protein
VVYHEPLLIYLLANTNLPDSDYNNLYPDRHRTEKFSGKRDTPWGNYMVRFTPMFLRRSAAGGCRNGRFEYILLAAF